MTIKQIRKYSKIFIDNIKTNEDLLKDLQTKCKHRNKTEKYGSNTGNWDPFADRYWVDFHCLDCDKRWTEDQ